MVQTSGPIPATPDKPKLTRDLLEKHRIFYNKEVFMEKGHTAIPSHVNDVRKTLLRFSIRIVDDNKTMLKKDESELKMHDGEYLDQFTPESAYIDRKETEWHSDNEMAVQMSDFAKSKLDAWSARRRAGESEAEWMQFFRENFFKRFECSQHMRHKDCVHYEEYIVTEDMAWGQFGKGSQWIKDNEAIGKRSSPKPDLTYGCLARDLTDYQGDFGGHYSLQSLSYDVFRTLLLKEPPVHSTVTTGLARWCENNKPSLGKNDFLCFPWAVVEAKHDQVTSQSEDFCFRQLANATACAYCLQEDLMEAAKHILPVAPTIGFTCVGPRVRVWLTYRDETMKIRMICIWATSIESIWGAMALRRVITNMHSWVSQWLRCRIISSIDQIGFMERVKPTSPGIKTTAVGNATPIGTAEATPNVTKIATPDSPTKATSVPPTATSADTTVRVGGKLIMRTKRGHRVVVRLPPVTRRDHRTTSSKVDIPVREPSCRSFPFMFDFNAAPSSGNTSTQGAGDNIVFDSPYSKSSQPRSSLLSKKSGPINFDSTTQSGPINFDSTTKSGPINFDSTTKSYDHKTPSSGTESFKVPWFNEIPNTSGIFNSGVNGSAPLATNHQDYEPGGKTSSRSSSLKGNTDTENTSLANQHSFAPSSTNRPFSGFKHLNPFDEPTKSLASIVAGIAALSFNAKDNLHSATPTIILPDGHDLTDRDPLPKIAHRRSLSASIEFGTSVNISSPSAPTGTWATSTKHFKTRNNLEGEFTNDMNELSCRVFQDSVQSVLRSTDEAVKKPKSNSGLNVNPLPFCLDRRRRAHSAPPSEEVRLKDELSQWLDLRKTTSIAPKL